MLQNVISYVSSHNNYDMFAGEVVNNLAFKGIEFINIDDKSEETERQKGIEICKNYSLIFLDNISRGVQWATQTLIDFINKNRPSCKWIICFQHDNFPLTNDFFKRFSKLVETGQLNEFSSAGFNVLDDGRYTGNAYVDWINGSKPLGILGLCHLSIRDSEKRWLCPVRNKAILADKSKWEKPFIIEMPMWAAVAINIEKWQNYIKPTDLYHFHLWYPDVMMQFNKSNTPCVILPDLYCMNRQSLKRKYNIPVNSAQAAKKGDHYHFGDYGPHLVHFKNRFGWDYENTKTFKKVRNKYRSTLLYSYYRHDITKGPLKTYDFGQY